MNDNLPPLPEPDHMLDCGTMPFFTTDQMLSYARAALAAQPGSVGEPVLLPEAVGHAADALTHIIAAAQSAKVALDAGLPNGQPVHPASARLTWPLSTAMMAEEKLRKLLAAAPTEAKPAQTDAVDAEKIEHAMQHARIAEDFIVRGAKDRPDLMCGYWDDACTHIGIALKDLESLAVKGGV